MHSLAHACAIILRREKRIQVLGYILSRSSVGTTQHAKAIDLPYLLFGDSVAILQPGHNAKFV
jgi:hypothetical protein